MPGVQEWNWNHDRESILQHRNPITRNVRPVIAAKCAGESFKDNQLPKRHPQRVRLENQSNLMLGVLFLPFFLFAFVLSPPELYKCGLFIVNTF